MDHQDDEINASANTNADAAGAAPDAAGATGQPDNGTPDIDTAGQQDDEFLAALSSATEGGLPPELQQQTESSGRARDAAGRFTSAQQPADASGSQLPAGQVPGAPGGAAGAPAGQPDKPAAPRTPEQEDADVLAGIQSERGRTRVQQIIEARKTAEGNVMAIREAVESAGLTPETFSQHLEFSRLLNSENPRDLESAAQMLEAVRSELYQRMGRDAPQTDVLAQYPDLAQKVQSLELPRDVALEVARMRYQNAQEQQTRQAQQQQQQQTARQQQEIAAAQQSLEAYVATRKDEIDHPARMKALQDYFANPQTLQQFAATYQPHQWPAAIRMLYDNIRIAPQQRQPAPISSRPAMAGRPALSADASGEDQILRTMQSMGLV